MGIENFPSFQSGQPKPPENKTIERESSEKEDIYLSKLEEEEKIIQTIEDPKVRVNSFLNLLEKYQGIENENKKKTKISSLTREILATLEASESSLWKHKKKIGEATILENERLNIYEKLVDIHLKNEQFLSSKEKEGQPSVFILDQIFSHWQKDLILPELDKLGEKKHTPEKVINQERAKEYFKFYQKALESSVSMAVNIKKEWETIEEDTKTFFSLEEKEKLSLLFNFTEKYLDKENPFEKVRSQKEIQKSLQNLNISPVPKEEIYENLIKISFLQGADFDNLNNYLEKYFPQINIRDRIKIDLVEILNLKAEDQEARIQEIFASFNLPSFSEKLEGKEILKPEKGTQVILELLKQNPELKIFLENPEIVKILQEKILEACNEIEKLLGEAQEGIAKTTQKEAEKIEKKEKIKEAVKEAKKSLAIHGFSLFGYSLLAFIILTLLVTTKLSEKISKSLSQSGKGLKLF